MEVNPLYFILTATVCVSYAFMFPIATPPNAIVFEYGYLRVIDMVKMKNKFPLILIQVIHL